MMKKLLNIGQSDFKNVIQNNNYFVDKSLFIEEFINSQSSVMLFPRPRRFGKTLNLSMLKHFFDKNQTDNYKLFTDLAIWKTSDEVKKHCGKYPVIFLSFKDAKAETWENTLGYLKLEIIQNFREHRYLYDTSFLFDDEKKFFSNILLNEASETDFGVSLNLLSNYLYRYHNQKVVILIDEYDTPIHAGYGTFYNEVVSFMRNFLSGAFKDNPNVYKGAITGILRVSKESIFSGLNNLSIYSILEDTFSDKFGFTETEVLQLLNDFEVTTDYAEIKQWYNGYQFGKTQGIYNPWSILNYVIHPEEGFKTFWANTSSNQLIRQEIKHKEASEIREEIVKLINGELIEKDIEESFVFPDLKTRKKLIWTLFVFSGYLTIQQQISRKKYQLRIPNYEIKTIFQDTLLEWFETEINLRDSLLETTIKNLLNNNIAEFEYGFKQIIGDTFSYYDTASSKQDRYLPEKVYQAYMLGLFAVIGDDFQIKSNRESGSGRYDIMLIPHDRSKKGIVMELKQIQAQKATESETEFAARVNKHLNLALQQIENNKYCKELIDCNIKEANIIKLPIVFAGKEPYAQFIVLEE